MTRRRLTSAPRGGAVKNRMDESLTEAPRMPRAVPGAFMRNLLFPAVAVTLLLAACGGEPEAGAPAAAAANQATLTVAESTITATFDAAGTAQPVEKATLSTRTMGHVTEVLVREGERVAKGQILVRVDARDIQAKRSQVEANLTAAEAMHSDAVTQTERIRALYRDSAATQYQLDQAETGLTRAASGLEAARGARAELDAMGAYTSLRAPFAGLVSRRYVDPGAFAAPGAPVVEVLDDRRLRVTVTVSPDVASRLRRGQSLEALVESRTTQATIEGIVPAPAGAVASVNAIITNAEGSFLPGSAATLRIPTGTRKAILVPATALVREGDLTGVRVKTGAGVELRWVKILESAAAGTVEVLAGLQSGDVILLGAS